MHLFLTNLLNVMVTVLKYSSINDKYMTCTKLALILHMDTDWKLYQTISKIWNALARTHCSQ